MGHRNLAKQKIAFSNDRMIESMLLNAYIDL